MTDAVTREQALGKLSGEGEDYELVEGTVFGRPCRLFKNGPKTLRELYEQNLSDETFIVYENERLSYRQTYEMASRVAKMMISEYGITSGDRVAISMRNFPEWIIAFCATTSIGGIAVAMNSLWNPEEMAYGLSDSGAKLLFADEERLQRLRQVKTTIDTKVIAVRAESETEYPDLNKLLDNYKSTQMPSALPQPEDIATLLYTSGSTGHPKGVASCHLNITTALLGWELDGQAGMMVNKLEPPILDHQPATLLAVPLFHATGSHAVFLQSYRHQRKIVSMYKWEPAAAAELIEKEKITSFIAPAAMTGDLVQEALRTNKDLSSLASVGGGGAPRAPEQVKNIHDSFEKAMPGTGWGMTETNAIGTGIGGQDYLDHPASSGRCSIVNELQVIGEKGEALEPMNRGELLIRGSTIFQGYWNKPEANAEVFTSDGWMKTGDVAYIDEEGYLYIVDRIKDLVIRGGENIGCGEVEAALLEHPDVLEASVYAVPDERLGEEVGATYYSSEELQEEDLRKFMADRLAKFKIPRYLWGQRNALPRTASGKILKREIREEAERRALA
ncbi:MAG: fatty acid--CoA ligase [Proteobacteria bacterium TMED261]|nr:MAG: fatty acid--CoA ligase [Proteobacteria bacterium TMED261]